MLLWHPDGDWVELSVRDVTTGATFDLDVAAENALDAFNHPYAYAAWRESSHQARHVETTSVDG